MDNDMHHLMFSNARMPWTPTRETLSPDFSIGEKSTPTRARENPWVVHIIVRWRASASTLRLRNNKIGGKGGNIEASPWGNGTLVHIIVQHLHVSGGATLNLHLPRCLAWSAILAPADRYLL